MVDNEGKTDLDNKDTPPWLMPVAEDDDVDASGWSMSKVISIAAVSFVVLSIAGLIFLYKNYDADDQAPKVIKADKTPVKKKPENPGGKNIPDQDKKIFDRMQGRGNQSGKVNIKRQPEEPVKKIPEKQLVKSAENTSNQTKQKSAEQKASKSDPVKKADDQTAKNTVTAKKPVKKAVKSPTVSNAKPKPISSGYDFYRVQLGSFRSKKAASQAWGQIKRSHSNLTKDMQDYIHPAVVGGKTYYRLSIGPLGSRAAADNTCLYFKTRDQACFVVSPTK